MDGKKRQRPVTSCLPCRKRRLKCDRVHPTCGRCLAGGTDCVYDESASANASVSAAPRSSTWQSASTSQFAPSSSTSYARPEEGRGTGAQTEPTAEPVSRQNNHERGQLAVYDGGRSAYVGSTYWANAIPPEINRDTVPTLADETSPFPKFPGRMQEGGLEWSGQKFRPPRNCGFEWTKSSSNKCKLCGRNYNISCVMALLPSREICEKLCGFFFSTVFPLTPIFHMKGFAEDFATFWDGMPPTNVHNAEPSVFMRKKPGFLSLLSAILFAAVFSASPARLERIFGEPTYLNPGDMYFIAMASASLTGFPRRPSIHSLAAYIIAQSQFVREEEFSDAPDFIATSFRVALGMGLHRQLPESGLPPAELETRRRLWWYILHLDVMSSSSSGLSPLFINQKMANTDAICQYDVHNDDPGARQDVDVRYLVASRRYEITREIRRVLVLHFEDAFQSPEVVADCAGRLRMIADRTSATVDTLLKARATAEAKVARSSTPRAVEQASSMLDFDRVWTLRPDPSDKEAVDFTAWSALLLHLMVHKAYCVLYHPLFRDPAMLADENIRTNAVKHAQAFIQVFIRVCNDPISDPFHWMYPGTYQPLQAVSLLLADLLQHPYSDDAALSRGLIDAIFELYQVDEGIVSQSDPPRRQLSPSGRDAWTMLVRTRRKALEQVGMDYHVLFPSNAVLSSRCICGEKISVVDTDAVTHQQALQPTRPGEGQQPPPPPIPQDMQGEQTEQAPGQMLYDQVDFDWHAWDNALGPSIGLMP
ncbi:hypothetical protein, variant 1 [Cladophialophora immunda]|uniref:Zn(2)-C6 fungal-type domain-containing protein n=1 Tax=Cladophialophora immunda TaxID=569365 RepID=A0A0D2B1X7_9EURO|nr:hypothetical protein, variant 1 [Cladophialophora immunda]KIW31647.1 hypothetical protein, variant 1 [Cladophialophora immunda]OQV09249.1 Fungal Zn2-Cys6 binuclear cluster domain-containing protein isoform 3 [Cladophialophora immunda]